MVRVLSHHSHLTDEKNKSGEITVYWMCSICYAHVRLLRTKKDTSTHLWAFVVKNPPAKGGDIRAACLIPESHGRRSLAGHSPRGHTRDTTDWACTHIHTWSLVSIETRGLHRRSRAERGRLRELEKAAGKRGRGERQGLWQGPVSLLPPPPKPPVTLLGRISAAPALVSVTSRLLVCLTQRARAASENPF